MWLRRRRLFGPGYDWQPDTISAGVGLLKKQAQAGDAHYLMEARNIYTGEHGAIVMDDQRLRLIETPVARIGSKLLRSVASLGTLHTKESFHSAGWSLTGKITKVRKESYVVPSQPAK